MIKLLFIPIIFVLTSLPISKCYAQFSLEIDQSVINDFEVEEHTFSFDEEFLAVKLDNVKLTQYKGEGPGIIKPLGSALGVAGVLVGVIAVVIGGMTASSPATPSEKRLGYSIMVGGGLTGLGVMYLGNYIYSLSEPKEENLNSKQKPKKSFKREDWVIED